MGANILSLVNVIKDGGLNLAMLPIYLVGMVVAGISGYFSISLVRRIAQKGKFGGFAYYCWAVGVIAIVASLIL